MSNCVFVINSEQYPCKPVHPAIARKMLASKQAAVFRTYPFTIICKGDTTTGPSPTDMQFKVDPGSRTTGIALVTESKVIWAAELEHRGSKIKSNLEKRRNCRASRRSRKTRYRRQRYLNRARPKGWLPPSLMHRVHTIRTWCDRLIRYAGVSSITMELVRFDMQKMQNAEISGVEYSRGTLAGFEVREYLLEKFDRTCVYCGKQGVPLEIEHIVPKSRGGSNRVSNLTLACSCCNQAKGSQTAEEFGHPKVQALAKKPLRDAAAVNTTRWRLFDELKATGLHVECGSGGQTKRNRTHFGLPKTHWLDAACVGNVESIEVKTSVLLLIQSTGHTCRIMRRPDRYGFPRQKPKGPSRVHGFKTGDIVKAIVTSGKKAGTYVGRVAVRSSGSFNVGKVQGIGWRKCRVLHHADGYSYQHSVLIDCSGHRVPSTTRCPSP